MDKKQRRVRSRIAIGFLVFAFFVIIARLAYLQLVKGEQYVAYAQQQRIRIVETVAARGDILAADGTVLATTRPVHTASLVYTGRPLPESARSLLKRILGVTDDDLDQAEAQVRNQKFRRAHLHVDLTPTQLTLLEEYRNELPGVLVESYPVREYPNGSLASHLLGYLRQDVEWDLVGRKGLEKTFDDFLRGSSGKQLVEVDADGRPVNILEEIDPVKGDTIITTIDTSLQAATERALREQMEALREDPRDPCPCPAGAASAVVLDVNSGAILALASLPDFDPNPYAVQPLLRRGSPGRMEVDRLLRDSVGHEFNRALQSRYPPGSVFKVITAIAGLESGFGNRIIYCGGSLTYGGRVYRDISAHGRTDLIKGLARSCNVYFWTVGLDIGTAKMGATASKLGLDGLSGLTDLDDEVPSAFPFQSDPLNTAIGQGEHLYTPLNFAATISTIANGGTRWRPFLVREAVSADGNIRYRYDPEPIEQVALDPQHLALLKQGMHGVTSCRDDWCGTAYGSFSDAPYRVAGKTGTVERSGLPSSHNYAWFAAFAPVDEPEIAVVVVVEEGGGGSRGAAPVARRIFDHYFGLDDAQDEQDLT